MKLALAATALALVLASRAGAAPTFRNPILPGFHPDPSMIRVGEDYYLITSSFEYFPGIPIFHSRDLVHWAPIGHVLTRPSQLDLDGIGSSDGIYASTIRHHKGTFYVVTTLVRRQPKERFSNFVVTAKNPGGPWSDPYLLSDTHYRIDPSLFFDDDGRAWFTANRTVTPRPHPSHRFITIQELDPKTMKLIGEPRDINEGHGRTANAPEGPHIYKKDGFYYLMLSEGGTFESHAVTIARAKSITGPYELAQANPILTHRHLGPGLDIHSVGHADLVETQKGEWWMVALGMRGVPGHCCNLGRETFLVPVSWPAGQWPMVNPGIGRVRMEERAPALPPFDPPLPPACDHFDAQDLGVPWTFVRTPRVAFWSLGQRPGHLRLRLKKETLSQIAAPAYVGRRLQHPSFAARTKLEFRPRADGEAAGLALRAGDNHIQFVKTRRSGAEILRVAVHAGNKARTLAEAPAPAGPLVLEIECRREVDCRFFFSGPAEAQRRKPVGGVVDGRALGAKEGGGAQFTGTFVGMYATSLGAASDNAADFDYFEYVGS